MIILGRTKSVPNHVSRPRQLLKSWSSLVQNKTKYLPLDYYSGRESLITGQKSVPDGDAKLTVPRGYVAVYVGSVNRRYVVPTTYLSMPDFTALMERSAEEFGYEQEGALTIPCEEEDFEDVLSKCLVNQQAMSKNRRKKRLRN